MATGGEGRICISDGCILLLGGCWLSHVRILGRSSGCLSLLLNAARPNGGSVGGDRGEGGVGGSVAGAGEKGEGERGVGEGATRAARSASRNSSSGGRGSHVGSTGGYA